MLLMTSSPLRRCRIQDLIPFRIDDTKLVSTTGPVRNLNFGVITTFYAESDGNVSAGPVRVAKVAPLTRSGQVDVFDGAAAMTAAVSIGLDHTNQQQ